MDEKKVYFFGDSITFGQLVSPHKIWVSRISEKVYKKYGGAVLVQADAVNGETSRQALERYHYCVLSHRPDVLHIQFGLNDCNFWETDLGKPRVTASSYKANLSELIEKAYAYKINKVVLHTNHVTPDKDYSFFTDQTFKDNIRIYNDIVREVANDFKVGLIDIEANQEQALKKDGLSYADFVLSDGIHLNECGHDLYYDSIEKVVLDNIQSVVERD